MVQIDKEAWGGQVQKQKATFGASKLPKTCLNMQKKAVHNTKDPNTSGLFHVSAHRVQFFQRKRNTLIEVIFL